MTDTSTLSPMLKMVKAKNPDKEYPSSLGKKWTHEEEQQLLSHIKDGNDKDAIAALHNRTVGAIQSRIRSMAHNMFLQNIPVEAISEATKLTTSEITDIIFKKNDVLIDSVLKKNAVLIDSVSKKNKTMEECSDITLLTVHQEIQTMKTEMNGLKNNVKELIELLQAIYEFSEE